MWKKIAMIGVLAMPMLSACGSADIPVSIHAVNYSNQEFVYFLEDSADKSNTGGGEAISRFAAGGTMCCYSLPKEWRPGLKVKVDYDVYVPNPGGEIPKTSNSRVIELPRYAKPPELWLVRDVQGEMSIVLSDFQPDHPQWPGKVKGWPVPSLEYRRERWGVYMHYELSGLKLFEKLNQELKDDPAKVANKAWPNDNQYNPDVKGKFSGPTDPNYLNYLKKDYARALTRAHSLVRDLEESKP